MKILGEVFVDQHLATLAHLKTESLFFCFLKTTFIGQANGKRTNKWIGQDRKNIVSTIGFNVYDRNIIKSQPTVWHTVLKHCSMIYSIILCIFLQFPGLYQTWQVVQGLSATIGAAKSVYLLTGPA